VEEENQQDRQPSQAIELRHCGSDKFLVNSFHHFAALDNYSVRFLSATSVKPWNFVVSKLIPSIRKAAALLL
jgi:hypothetical protein